MPMDDARHVVAEYTQMGTAAAASQATILRRESIRLRQAILSGTLQAAATTRVFLTGVASPVMLSYTALVENGTTADNWVGYDYSLAAHTATTGFAIHWDGPAHPTSGNRNSWLFDNVVANLQGQKYRIWCTYVERL